MHELKTNFSVTLVRHGESINQILHILAGDRDYDLTERGIQQSICFGQTISDSWDDFDQIHCSTVKRARETLIYAARGKEVAVQYSDAIREINVGDSFNIDYEEFQLNGGYLPYINAPFKPFPNGETFASFQSRIIDFIDEIQVSGGHHLIFTHAGVINLFLHHLDQLDVELYPYYEIKNCEPITRSVALS